MTDITGGLDLLGDWLDAKGYTEEAGLCTKAMDEINRLQAELTILKGDMPARAAILKLAEQNTEIEALRAENARLQKDLHEYVMQAESGNQKHVAEMCELRKENARLLEERASIIDRCTKVARVNYDVKNFAASEDYVDGYNAAGEDAASAIRDMGERDD